MSKTQKLKVYNIENKIKDLTRSKLVQSTQHLKSLELDGIFCSVDSRKVAKALHLSASFVRLEFFWLKLRQRAALRLRETALFDFGTTYCHLSETVQLYWPHCKRWFDTWVQLSSSEYSWLLETFLQWIMITLLVLRYFGLFVRSLSPHYFKIFQNRIHLCWFYCLNQKLVWKLEKASLMSSKASKVPNSTSQISTLNNLQTIFY